MRLNHIAPGVWVSFDYFKPLKGGGFDTNKERYPRVAEVVEHKPKHNMTLVKDNKGRYKNIKWNGVTNLNILDVVR